MSKQVCFMYMYAHDIRCHTLARYYYPPRAMPANCCAHPFSPSSTTDTAGQAAPRLHCRGSVAGWPRDRGVIYIFFWRGPKMYLTHSEGAPFKRQPCVVRKKAANAAGRQWVWIGSSGDLVEVCELGWGVVTGVVDGCRELFVTWRGSLLRRLSGFSAYQCCSRSGRLIVATLHVSRTSAA